MAALVASEIADGQTFAEQSSLTEAEAKTFAGDGIDSAGGVTDQGGASAINVAKTLGDGNGSAFVGGVFGVFEPTRKFGEVRKSIFQTQLLIGRDRSDADFFVADGRDINLGAIAPMQFHALGPGRDAIVTTESETKILAAVCSEIAGRKFCPITNAGRGAIGTDDPTGTHQFPGDEYTFRVKTRHSGLPKETNASSGGTLAHQLMQIRATNPIGGSARKFSLSFCATAHETNAVERKRFVFRDGDAEVAKSFHSVGHQAFAARLVDRGDRSIRENHAETETPRGDGACEARGSAANYKHVPRFGKGSCHNTGAM